MRKIYKQIKELSVIGILFFCSLTVSAQPGRLEGDFGAAWSNYDLTDRGNVKSVIIQASTTNFAAGFLFNNANGDYNPKWTGSNAPDVTRNVDMLHVGGAYISYNTNNAWTQNLETSIASGKYYTFIIEDIAANASMSILETNYIPVSINSVTQLPAASIESTQSVDVTVTLSGVKDVSEKVFVRYTTDAWSTSNFVEITTFDGSFQGTATIPAQASLTNVEYYILTTKEVAPSGSTIDYFSLNIDNNLGANYSYSVVAGAPAPTIALSDDGQITEGTENGEIISILLRNDVFQASLDVANWTISNLPVGVTVGSLTRLTDTTATITLSGNASVDYDVDITDLTVEISNLELVTLSTGSVSANNGVTFTAIVETPAIWMHMLTSDSLVFTVGDNTASWINAEIGQASWSVSQIGYGTSNTDTTGWTWLDATWYADGSGSNKQVHAEVSVPSVAGVYYYVARAKALPTDNWTYANDTVWTDGQVFAPVFKITVNDITTISKVNLDDKSDINVYPNPIENIVNIKLENENISDVFIVVKDILGKTVYTSNLDNVCEKYSKSIDLSKLNKGLYIVEITSNDERFSKTIIKK